MSTVGMPIAARLKAETAAQHDALERRLDIVGRLDSLAAYCSLLGRFLGVYEPLEARLRLVVRAHPLPLSLDGRWKVAWLMDDLRALGYSPAELAALPRCTDLPLLTRPAEALGCLYVLEGATLGGQLIARLLARRFGLDPSNGGAFFASYGDRVGPMWREFGAALVGFSDERRGDEAILRSARGTFAALERWIAGEPGSARGRT